MRWREWILRLLVLAGLAPAVALPAFASCGVIAGTQPFGPPRWQPVAYRPAAVAPTKCG